MGFPHPPLRKSFVCDDSRNTIYAKHNIICRKATSFSERKRKRYLRLWRKMVFLPAVGNTTLRVVVPLPPREGSHSPSNFTKIKMICIDRNTYHLILSLIGASLRRSCNTYYLLPRTYYFLLPKKS